MVAARGVRIVMAAPVVAAVAGTATLHVRRHHMLIAVRRGRETPDPGAAFEVAANRLWTAIGTVAVPPAIAGAALIEKHLEQRQVCGCPGGVAYGRAQGCVVHGIERAAHITI